MAEEELQCASEADVQGFCTADIREATIHLRSAKLGGSPRMSDNNSPVGVLDLDASSSALASSRADEGDMSSRPSLSRTPLNASKLEQQLEQLDTALQAQLARHDVTSSAVRPSPPARLTPKEEQDDLSALVSKLRGGTGVSGVPGDLLATQADMNFKAIRADMGVLTSVVAGIHKELRAQQESHNEHLEATRLETFNKVEQLQQLCHDTATMAMQHAQAVLGMGLRIDVVQEHLDLDTARSLEQGNSLPGSSRCLSSIEARLQRLEDKVLGEVHQALSEIGCEKAMQHASPLSPRSVEQLSQIILQQPPFAPDSRKVSLGAVLGSPPMPFREAGVAKALQQVAWTPSTVSYAAPTSAATPGVKKIRPSPVSRQASSVGISFSPQLSFVRSGNQSYAGDRSVQCPSAGTLSSPLAWRNPAPAVTRSGSSPSSLEQSRHSPPLPMPTEQVRSHSPTVMLRDSNGGRTVSQLAIGNTLSSSLPTNQPEVFARPPSPIVASRAPIIGTADVPSTRSPPSVQRIVSRSLDTTVAVSPERPPGSVAILTQPRQRIGSPRSMQQSASSSPLPHAARGPQPLQHSIPTLRTRTSVHGGLQR